jgi:hypothetical protein
LNLWGARTYTKCCAHRISLYPHNSLMRRGLLPAQFQRALSDMFSTGRVWTQAVWFLTLCILPPVRAIICHRSNMTLTEYYHTFEWAVCKVASSKALKLNSFMKFRIWLFPSVCLELHCSFMSKTTAYC